MMLVDAPTMPVPVRLAQTSIGGSTCVLSCAVADCDPSAATSAATHENGNFNPMTNAPSFASAHANASGEDEPRCEERREPPPVLGGLHVRNVVGEASLTAFAPALPSPLRKTAPYGLPVHRLGDRAGRSPGLRVIVSTVRPSQFPSGRNLDPRLAAHSCGGSHGFVQIPDAEFKTSVFPLSSPTPRGTSTSKLFLERARESSVAPYAISAVRLARGLFDDPPMIGRLDVFHRQNHDGGRLISV